MNEKPGVWKWKYQLEFLKLIENDVLHYCFQLLGNILLPLIKGFQGIVLSLGPTMVYNILELAQRAV